MTLQAICIRRVSNNALCSLPNPGDQHNDCTSKRPSNYDALISCLPNEQRLGIDRIRPPGFATTTRRMSWTSELIMTNG